MDNPIIFVVVAVLAVIIVSIRNYLKKNSDLKDEIISKWGKQPEKKFEKDELTSIASYFINTSGDKEFYIDDITWNDLSMDDVFARMNNTQSSVGEEFLYKQLREPLFDKDPLSKMDATIDLFSRKEKERVQIAYYLAKLGKEKAVCISDFFTHKWKQSNHLIYYRIMSLLPIVSLPIAIIYPVAFFVPLLSLIANVAIHSH